MPHLNYTHSYISKNPMLHAHFIALCFREGTRVIADGSFTLRE